jgi:amidase
MKPTRARTPAGPDASESWFGFAIEHAMTLSVRDNAALLDATSAPAHDAPYAAPKPERPFLEETRRDPGKLRIAVCRTPFLPGDPEPAVLHALDDAAKLCRELGHEIEEVGPAIDRDQFAVDFTTLVAVATAVDIDEGERVVGRKATHRDFETNTWVVSQIGRNLDAVQVESARRRLLTMSRSVAGFMQRYDAMLTPTLGQSPPRHGALTPPPWLQKAEELIAKTGARAVLKIPGVVEMAAKQTYQFIPYTPLANVTGQPSMNVPLYWEDGLPQGVNFSARHGDEATLYRLAAQLELARPWRDKIPPVNAA